MQKYLVNIKNTQVVFTLHENDQKNFEFIEKTLLEYQKTMDIAAMARNCSDISIPNSYYFLDNFNDITLLLDRSTLIAHKDSQIIYKGLISGFAKELFSHNNYINYLKYKNKVIRFTYHGGTNPDSIRVVKVIDFDNNIIYTKDLVKNAPRNFFINKIQNLEVMG